MTEVKTSMDQNAKKQREQKEYQEYVNCLLYTSRPVLAKQQIADAWTRAVKSKTEQGKMYCLGSLYLAGMIKREILQPGS